MRNYEDKLLALECLKLAAGDTEDWADPEVVVGRADAYYAFVTGTDTDDAKAKLSAVLKAVS